MMSSKRMALFSLIAVFIFGVVIGIAVDRFMFIRKPDYPQKPKDISQHLFEHFTEKLDLNTEQQDQLKKLLDEIRSRHREIEKSERQKYRQLRESFDEKLIEILHEEQVEKFKELQKQYKEKRRNHKPSKR